MLFNRHVVIAHVGKPVDHISTAIETRTARSLAHSQRHLASSEMQILSNLRPGLAGPHYQHAAFRQALGIAIVGGMNLQHVIGKALCHARYDRRMIATRRYHHLVCSEVAT